jgi:SAM-dependent methyltransferase
MKYSPPRYLLRRHTILKNVGGDGKFLEVGAGNLQMSSELSRVFKSGTCIDFSPKIQKLHKQLPAETQNKLDIVVGDFFTHPFDTKFDAVISCEVMEHIEDDKKFLARTRSLLKRNGQVIISVPAKQKYWTVHDEIAGHFRRYEKNDLIALFEDAGYKDIAILSYGFPFINILWRLRKVHGQMQARKKSSWSKHQQTEDSGTGDISPALALLGIFANKHVFYLPNLIAANFYHLDLSEGYVVVARA